MAYFVDEHFIAEYGLLLIDLSPDPYAPYALGCEFSFPNGDLVRLYSLADTVGKVCEGEFYVMALSKYSLYCLRYEKETDSGIFIVRKTD